MADSFDFVVVGGGSGGCAVASRLSEDPGTSVALLEAGGTDDNWVVTTPGAMILMISGKLNNWAFETVPQAGLNGRIGYQPRGKGLGGSSAINAMVYIRGHRRDYDRWASLGNAGWSYADVLPYFKRSEDNSELEGEYHGKGGPLHVTGLRTDNPVREIYLQAAREAQFRIREDFNGEEQEGLGSYQVTQKNGERWSAARGYIHPFMKSRSNLRVETRAHATRILFEGKRAVGVEYRQGKELKQIRARREVIVSSGAFQTPQLLMLSGVGDAAALAKHGIAATQHLPGVGQNLQDHPDFVFGFTSDSPHFAGLSFGGIARIFKGIAQYPARAARTDDIERRRMRRLPQDPPRPRCARYPVAFLHGDGRRPWPQTALGHRLLMPCLPVAARKPRQRLAAKRRSDAAPAIDPNFLGDGNRCRCDGRRLQNDKAAARCAGAESAANLRCVHRRRRDRRHIRKVLRHDVDTVYHPVGTCKMGVNDPLAVNNTTVEDRHLLAQRLQPLKAPATGNTLTFSRISSRRARHQRSYQ